MGALPTSVAIGDFNGDGKADLAVKNENSGNVSILLGNGDGTFAAAVNFAVGTEPWSVAVGDFNGDGKADLAVADAGSDGGDSVSILLGNGDGTFAAAANYAVGVLPYAVAVGDFNGDGKADLACVNESSGTVSILLGNGDGTFGAAVNYSVGTQPYSVVVGDFNSDSKADLAVANLGTGNVSILLGKGDGTFGAAANYAVAANPYSLAQGDFNGDGKTDLAVTSIVVNSANGASVNILLGNGDGTFAAPVPYGTGTIGYSVAVGDFNGDGKADLAATGISRNVIILLGVGPATAMAASSGTPQSTPISTAFASALEATVTDSSGNAVSGVTVTFAAPASGASATLSSGAAITNNAGVASITAIANLTAGSYNVTASAAGVAAPATFVLTNLAGPPASITATGGTPQSTVVNTPFGAPLQVTVTDAGGNPVSGVAFAFAVPASGASATISSPNAVTNIAGVASVTAIANAIAGSYGVTATRILPRARPVSALSGGLGPAIFNLTNLPGGVSAITATAGAAKAYKSIRLSAAF